MKEGYSMMRRTVLATLFAVLLAPAAYGQKPPVVDEDNDSLPGARVSPTRGEIEALIRAVGRDPVTPELVNRVDAIFRPRFARPSHFGGAKGRALDRAYVATMDEIAREVTKKPVATRMLISRAADHYNNPDRNSLESGFRQELAREDGPRKTIKGRILDEEAGRPLAGVVVSAAGVLTRTDANGDYILKAREPAYQGPLIVSFEAPGYALTQTGFAWKDIGDREASDHSLPRSVPFAGKVVDADGKPIVGADLHLWLMGGATSRDGSLKWLKYHMSTILEARTDADGAYSFRNVPPDLDERVAATRLTVRHPKYEERRKDYANNELLGPGWQITLERGCVVTGILVDEAGKPVAHADISAASGVIRGEDPSTQTDASGKFRFDNLPERSLRIVARPTDHATTFEIAILKRAAPANVTLKVEAGVFITGRVIGTDGKPAPNAMVLWPEPVDDTDVPIQPHDNENRSTHTKLDGTFRVGPVAWGRYRIGALVDPPRAETNKIVETDGKDILLELKLVKP